MRALNRESPKAAAFRAPALVFLLMVLITAFVAGTRSSALRHERSLLFEARAAEIQQAVVTSSNQKVNDFRAAVNFVGTTHPGPVEQYESFFNRELPDLDDQDPGIMVLEEFHVLDLDSLEERERSIGNTDFEVTVFPSPVEDRLIVTRATNDIQLFDLRLVGLDVTLVRETLVPSGLPDDDFQLHIADSAQLLDFVNGSADETLLDDLTAVLIANINDETRTSPSYVVRFDSLRTYLTVLDETNLSDLNVELWAEGVDRPVGQRLSEEVTAQDDADLSSSQNVETATLAWRIDVWANDDFGPPTGLFEQRAIWAVGLFAAILASLVLAWRDRAAQRLDNARVELAHVRTLAATDALTGLLNRAGLVDAAREIDPERPAALFFIDLDGFKTVNDAHGHEHGDSVLREVAAAIKSVFRPDDLVGRLGGDEFVVFTIDTGGPDYLNQISDRITTSIADVDPNITASLGVATRSLGDETDVKTMLRTADEAMYEAKRSGGDTFTVRSRSAP